mmetsp:Transcript_4692/g.13542  ORF Transcript_4692/g.13542 Transcript_4692/m.13542 type:complete len:207 (+) Transcript_4692:1154-1774(+)
MRGCVPGGRSGAPFQCHHPVRRIVLQRSSAKDGGKQRGRGQPKQDVRVLLLDLNQRIFSPGLGHDRPDYGRRRRRIGGLAVAVVLEFVVGRKQAFQNGVGQSHNSRSSVPHKSRAVRDHRCGQRCLEGMPLAGRKEFSRLRDGRNGGQKRRVVAVAAVLDVSEPRRQSTGEVPVKRKRAQSRVEGPLSAEFCVGRTRARTSGDPPH